MTEPMPSPMSIDETPRRHRWPIWPWLVLAVAGAVVTATAAIVGTASDGDDGGAAPSTATTTLTVLRYETSTVTETVTVEAPAPAGPVRELVDGLHRVGVDVAPGSYRTPGPVDADARGCYWTRSTLTGEFLDNGVLYRPGTITLEPNELIETAGCQPWALEP